jgi:hypothetical protein
VQCQVIFAKIFTFAKIGNDDLTVPSRTRQRGASRSSRNVVRDAMDVWCRKTCEIDAYGQAVWSCPLDAGVKLRKAICAATVANKPTHRGERGISRKAIAQGVPDCFGEPVVTTCSCAFYPFLHARLRVRPAPGIPCALCFSEGHRTTYPDAKSRRGNAESYPFIIAIRHCERSEAIQTISADAVWIASSLTLLAMARAAI